MFYLNNSFRGSMTAQACAVFMALLAGLIPAVVNAASPVASKATMQAGAADAPTDNPFEQGTRRIELTPAERASLLEYADNSKARLERALDDAKGKAFEDANGIYLAAIKNVVIASFQSKPRTDLLMRYALNQALELTAGVPTANGSGIVKAGVLAGSINQELVTIILEDSISLALQYYENDRQAIEKGSFIDLPYISFAQGHLTLARTWLTSILEWDYAYRFSIVVLKEWFAAVANEEQQHKILLAEEITNVDALIHEFEGSPLPPHDNAQLGRRVRRLRKILRQTVETTQKKIVQSSIVSKPLPNIIGGSAGTNSLSMQFVAIQPGTFVMGSPARESGRYDDETQHGVQITRSFEMQTTEVTQSQWFAVMGNNPSGFKSKNNCQSDYLEKDGIPLCPNNPVEQVSWDDSQSYIQRLNQRSDGYTYRLPTEAEWEYAARAGSTTAYSFGDNASQLADYAWTSENSGSQTHVVGSKKPNAWGLYDMHGNVWQWVQDWYGEYSSTSGIDPQGASSGSFRVVRGGGWNNDARLARSALRSHGGPGGRYSDVGLRLVRTH